MQGTLSLPSKHSLPTQPSRRRTASVRASIAEVAPPSDAAGRSLYEVLRIRRNASPVEIKTAYRTLAKLYHPDATSRFMESPPATSDFIEIHNAYATLSDPDARAEYDINLKVGSGYRSSGRGRFNPTRKWETDQCW
ncbi:chaperone protein DNAj [Striga asiatica]|uniref:Chaperone protein DNAj n=1 Tax=Striga asiatica TaxID=4170 RepID=A0A5A7PMQ1_STRAF|nr:chaperone protein DNAj [Striga asiatica]